MLRFGFSLFLFTLLLFENIGFAQEKDIRVSSIHWNSLNTEVLIDASTHSALNLFRNGLKYVVNDWYHTSKEYSHQTGVYLDFKGKSEHHIRPVSHVVFSLAVALRFHIYDEAIAEVSVTEAERMAVKLISSLAYRHKVSIGEKKGWGNAWQSAWWASQTAFAAWLLWDELDEETHSRIFEMIVYEANRFIDYKIPYYKDKNGNVIYKGDSKSEENAWNSYLLVIASVMFPEHQNALLWNRRALELQLSA